MLCVYSAVSGAVATMKGKKEHNFKTKSGEKHFIVYVMKTDQVKAPNQTKISLFFPIFSTFGTTKKDDSKIKAVRAFAKSVNQFQPQDTPV